jgi:hypothetical protein
MASVTLRSGANNKTSNEQIDHTGTFSRKDAKADKKDKVFVSFVRFVVNLYDFLTGRASTSETNSQTQTRIK